MTRAQILPTVLIIIDVAACAVYASEGDWRHAGYWIAAGAITFFATF